MKLSQEQVIQITRCWIEKVVIAENFCPFAKPVIERQELHYSVMEEGAIEPVLHRLMSECQRLDSDDSVDTTLLILTKGFESFDAFLDMVDMADRLLVEQGYEGIYQLAHFHPDYCFNGVEVNDAQNYTNRSPFPMLHLLRERSIEQVLVKVKAPENIPQRNIRHAQKLGVNALSTRLGLCFKQHEES